MPIEEQAEEKIQNAVQTIITGGAKLMLRIPKGVAMAMLRSGMKLAKTGVHAAGAAVKDGIDSGEMSEKRLQRKKDGDLHELQLDDSTMREVQRSLKQAGIDYHLERADQGQFILHFAGRDEDHVRHAVQRAFKGMGLDVADDDFAVEQTEQQERTTEQTRNEPETPARETPVEPAAKPMRPSASHGTSWIRRSWRWPRTASPPGIPNSRGTSSWATRHGMSRPAATSRTGSSARPPPTRHCATSSTPSCETTTAGRANPGAEPCADTRAKPGDAGNGAGTHAGRNPVEGPATADASQNQWPQATGKAQKPKPIRSKKALLERFKTRLNENLAEQKNHMPPTQNRDRTPRKGR